MSNEARSDGLDHAVAAEQVKLLYRQLPVSGVIPVLAAAVLVYFFRGYVSPQRLWTWFVLVATSYALLPTLLYRAYRRAGANGDPRLWGRSFTWIALATTSCWGLAGVLLFVPGSELHQTLLFVSLFAGAAAVTATTLAHAPGFYAGVLPMLAPVSLRYALEGETPHLAMAGVGAASFLMLAFLHRNMHACINEALALRFERERLIEQLEHKNAQVERANQAKSRFLAAASHDLRQPLHAQRLFLGELKARSGDGEAQRIVRCMEQSIGSTEMLLNELVEISRLDAGVIRPNPVAFAIAPVLERLRNEFAAQAAKNNLRYRVPGCSFAVRSDPALLERILRNLVDNAMRYTSQGAVMIACRRRGAMLEIQVRDSGPGIDSSDQDLIFDEFTQLQNVERSREKGMGLGLAIVRRLAALLDHPVRIESKPGAGSAFSVSVPIADAPAAGSLAESARRGHPGALAGLRVLVIEDDADIRVATAGLLRLWKCIAQLAIDGDDAVGKVGDGFRPAVILADYLLPGMTGFAAVQAVRARLGEHVAAICVSGDIAAERLSEARAHGCLLLHKPVEPETLYGLLCNIDRPDEAHRPLTAP